MLPDDDDLADVREWQVRHVFRSIELFNADFCLPVRYNRCQRTHLLLCIICVYICLILQIIVGASVHATPSSPLYHLITQGFPKVEPQPPEAPKPPNVNVLSMASVR